MLRTNRARLVALVLVWVAFASSSARAQTPAQSPSQTPAPPYETARLESKLMGRAMPYNVLLPSDYAASKDKLYPVLYLLHGLYGKHDDWLVRSRLVEHASAHHFIIVTPEGGNGWYTDGASDPSEKYESYIVRELVPEVERRFRTLRAREGRGVAGLSMGGYGALKFGVKYPELFAFAGSTSGAVSVASWRSETDLPERLRPFIVRTFGPADGATKKSNDLFLLLRSFPAERLPALPFFYFDCGTEDPLELLAPNRALADLLAERKIAHEYRQLPGDHSWPYWDRQVQEILRVAARKLSPPVAVATK
ncbi:MAG TPA: alpha/beta hydrolase family protein [Pyrinomonadaceae bacterium]|nr:alpha/beta hydrolase family protein [Pyrinomonadaceae bacterium]